MQFLTSVVYIVEGDTAKQDQRHYISSVLQWTGIGLTIGILLMVGLLILAAVVFRFYTKKKLQTKGARVSIF